MTHATMPARTVPPTALTNVRRGGSQVAVRMGRSMA
jgi:hypothetical protein